ncbi:MAG: signal peptidase I [Pseudomonadota bacterium]
MANYFSIFLVVISLITGLVWLVYAQFMAQRTSATVDANNVEQQSIDTVQDQMPPFVDFCKQMFPIFFGVMIFRSFIYEPFQIPSGSMMPNLLVGDFILVEKFSYGLRDPVWRSKLMETGEVERGDVIVFKFPENPSQDFIKRVIGLPGDVVEYRNKQIFITPHCQDGENCQGRQPVSLKSLGAGEYQMYGRPLSLFNEDLLGVEHEILKDPSRPHRSTQRRVVPENSYFVMGDNRDHSDDGRRWGFVPEENLVGQAVFIWISFEFGRNPDDILPTWLPTGIRFSRVGKLN